MVPNNPILEAQADFAVNLLRESVNANQNASVIISPVSVAIALSMVYAGAKDQTADEIAAVIAKGQDSEKIHAYFGSLIQGIAGNAQKNYTLETANRIYVKESYTLLQAYKDVLKSHYLGEFQSVDFTRSAETAKAINDFVAEKTHDKIKDLIKPDNLDALTRLVLINAIYFKGNWASKFNASSTEKKPFYQTPDNEVQVDMMQKKSKEKFFYDENDAYQVLGMPYEGSEVFMFIVLPKERYGLEAVLKNLNGSALLNIVKNRRRSDVIVSIPKFKVESTHQLNEHLKKMGVNKAFDQAAANLGGIADLSNGQLYISDAIQKAFIEVNEDGSEAAAATAVVVTTKSAPMRPRTLNANHPFLYIIASHVGEIFFTGRHT